MTLYFDRELEAIAALQSWTGWGALMEGLSHLGPSKYTMAAIVVLLVARNPRLGARLLILYCVAEVLAYLLKMGFQSPRPYWVDPRIARLGPETKSFGFPSGHALVGAAIWWAVAAHYARPWIGWVCALATLSIALSRVYLGVHFISDVVAGTILGGWLGWLTCRRTRPMRELWIDRAGRELWVWPAFALLAIGLGVFLRNRALDPRLETLPWHGFSDTSRFLQVLASFAGAMAGVGSGWQWTLRHGLEPWATPTTLRDGCTRLIRLAPFGLAGWWLIRRAFPKEPEWLAVPLHFVACAAAGISLVFAVPWIHRKLGLGSTPPHDPAQAAPNPNLTNSNQP